MTIEVKFSRGASSFSLTAGAYSVGNDFAPPGINATYNISAGTSANSNGGGSVLGARAKNRSWIFQVRILASSINEAHSHARKLIGFIKAQSNEPLYIDYRENTEIPVPLWGQFGAPLRFEVVTCDVSGISDAYLRANGKGFFVTVVLEIKPLAVGLKQSLVSAKGIVIEDTLGRTDEASGGLIVSPVGHTTVNFFTNPVHGNGTYSTGWTAGADLIAVKNIDPEFLLFGAVSVRITQKSSAVSTAYTSLVTAGSTGQHVISAYFKKQDSSAITSTDVRLIYNGSLATTSFDAIGNGWYRAYAVVTGVAAATAAGCALLTVGISLYATGFQFERQFYSRPLPFMYGDMLGCAWSSTVHASATTGTAGGVYARSADMFSVAQGTICIVWKADNSSAAKTTAGWMFQDNSVGFRGGWNGALGRWFFNDGTTAMTSSLDSFAMGETIVLHFVWGLAQLTIYKNGVAVGTSANYTPATLGANFYIGSDSAVANPVAGTFMGLTTYDVAFTADQALAAFQAIDGVTSGGNRVDAIPWLWTKDGDRIVDNCNDSSRDNWCAIGGVAGNLPARYAHYMATNWTTQRAAMWLVSSDFAYNEFIDPATTFYDDMNSVADAACSGGGYDALLLPSFPSWSIVAKPNLFKKYNFFGRMAKSTGSGTSNATPYVTSGETYYGAVKNIALTTTQTLYHFGDAVLGNPFPEGFGWMGENHNGVLFGIACDGAMTMHWDFAMALPGKLVKFVGSPSFSGYTIGYDGERAYSVKTDGLYDISLAVLGEKLDLMPGRLNMIWMVNSDHGEAMTISDTATFTTFITPVFALV